MKLKVKILNIITGGPLVALVNKKDAHIINLEALSRIKITKNKQSIIAIIDIANDNNYISQGEIGIFTEVLKDLKVNNKEFVEIIEEPKPYSLSLIKKKLDGIELKRDEIHSIIKDIVNNKLTEVETTYFVSACYINKMTLNESAYLTEAIVKSSSRLKFPGKNIIDKHSVSGIPGNRTTPIIVPIIAAAGFIIPKTSTRSITSPSGSADTFEVLAPVSHSKEKILEIVKKTNACIVWGGTMDLAAADDKLIKLEKALNLDPEGILLASILSKKSAVDSDKILIDIPCGKEAKIPNQKKARQLGKKFIILGKKLGMKIKILITDGSHPIGKGIGPALEARDVLLVLQNKGPKDLRNKALYMAGIMLEMAGLKNGYKKAFELINNGKAYEKLKEIIKAQGGNPNIKPEEIELGRFTYKIESEKTGKVISISNSLVSKIAKGAGAPYDKGAGIYLNVQLNETVNKGQTLFTIYSENKEKLNYALKENLKGVYKIKA